MLLIDLNQVMISNLMAQVGHSKIKIEEDLVRHMVLNTIRLNVKMFRKYGKVVIACDNRKYWRRDFFPNYKASRKKNRETSEHDWNTIFECLNKIRDELKEFSPYTVLDVEGSEADDIIAVLSKQYCVSQPVMILSSDKDFIQLQKYANISQYSPILKKTISCSNPQSFLKEMIIKGDTSDGVPNILSSDDVFICEDKRQSSITKKKLEVWIEQSPKDFCNEEMYKNYSRNEMLIDLEMIPNFIQEKILLNYTDSRPATKQSFLNYMIKNKLINLMEVFDDF